MSPRLPRESYRGFFRGFFVWVTALSVVAAGCEKKPEEQETGAATIVVDAGGADGSVSTRDASAGVESMEPAEALTRTPLRLPWVDRPSTLDELDLPTEPIGTLSGEIFGKERPVRAVSRVDCGAGTILQAVFEDERGELRVTPGMGVRFFGLPKDEVSYQDKDFELTLSFSHDTPERLKGALSISYGEGRTYAELEVDGDPLPFLLEPRLAGDGEVPLFEGCFPNGYVLIEDAEGDEHRGYVNATRYDAKGHGAVVVKPLLHANAGLEIAIGLRDKDAEHTEPVALPLAEGRNPVAGQDVVVFVEAWYAPELAPPAEAAGMNIGKQQKVNVRDGEAEIALTKQRGKWYLELTLTDVRVPSLIDGPLSGRTLRRVEIAAWPVAPGEIGEIGDVEPGFWAPAE